VLEHYKLDREEVERALFPHVRYRKQALDRVLKGEGQLTVEQLQILAKLSGVFIQDLFSLDDWKGGREDDCLTFIKGEFKVKLNYKGVYLSIYKGNDLVKQEITSVDRTVEEFLEHITLLINKL
jgi:hypothetical protein